MIPTRNSARAQIALGMLLVVILQNPTLSQQVPTDLSGFTPDEIFAIADGQPLTTDDSNLARLLFRVQKTSDRTLARFSQQNQTTTLTEITGDPRSYRGYVFHLNGTARSIRQIKNSKPELNLGTTFTLVHMVIGQQDCLLAVTDNGCPRRWLQDRPLNERIETRAFFLANFDFHPENDVTKNVIRMPNLNSTTIPVFVAKSIQWFPDKPSQDFNISESELLLAQHNVDIASLDRVRENVVGKIDQESATSFYQILNAAQQIHPEQFPESKKSFIDCLQDPIGNQSSAVRITGQVRRVTEIKIDDDYFKSLGLAQYFQLDVFVPLGENKIVFRSPKSNPDSKPLVHENRFPVTVCVAQLPSDDILKQNVTIDTFFFQRWNFESRQSELNQDMLQDAPLFIGLQPEVSVENTNPINFWIGLASAMVLIGIGLIYWFYGRDRNTHRNHYRLKRELPSQIEIPEMDGEKSG